MAPHQERVVTEKAELDEKLEKLRAFFSNPLFEGLDEAEKVMLQRQQKIMSDYSEVLMERIAAF